MKDSVLRLKTKQLAINIVKITKTVKESKNEFVLSNQLLRSGTSVGANVHEANYAQGVNDFISKLEIALKECYESEYWLDLLFETNYISESDYKSLITECGVIRKMLINSCKTVKENNNIL